MQIKSFLREAAFRATLCLMIATFNTGAHAQQVLPTGATITPNAARDAVFQPLRVALPDFPNYTPDGAETTAVSPDGKTLLILTSGYNFNLDSSGNYQPSDSGEFVFVYDISKPNTPIKKQVVFLENGRAFDGLVWSPDGSKFYVAGGADDNIHTFARSAGQWAEVGSPISLGHSGDLMSKETFVGPTAAMLGITADGKTLVVANHETDSITVVDLVHGTVQQEFDLRPGLINPAETGVPGGEFPYGVAVKGNNTVYVSSVRDREIDVLSLNSGALTLANRIPVSGNPGKMILNAAQTRLFVVANNSDNLIIINTNSSKVVGQVNATAPPGLLGRFGKVPKGSNPNSVALSPNEQIAYVTDGGTNAVAVIRVADDDEPAVVGLIPTGWYPNSVSTSPDGSTLYVVNGKSVEASNPLNCRYINDQPGGGFGSNCQGVSAQNGSGNQYAWQNEYSGFLTLPVPNVFDLMRLTEQVAKNNGFNLRLSREEQGTMAFLRNHIKHVIYMVKENRTFDQVLGDLKNGANADPGLTQFPEAVTPNFHNFANNFVTFDNFDDTSMVSFDGWQWSTAARTLDINEKCVPVNYGKGGCNYDSEGTSRNINVARVGVAARKAWQPLYPNDPNLLPGTANEMEADGPEDQQGAGYIWDAAIQVGLSVRNYGFYLDLGAVQGLDPKLTNPCGQNPPVQVAFPAHPSLMDKTDFCFRGFDQTFPDYFRYTEWAREFDSYVKNGNLPALELVRFNHDHFGSFGSASFGVNTPELQMADDDYSVGLLVEKIAHSPYANDTLIFVIEDDPQDGADHVSGDRSLAFILGPYVRQGGAVVSDSYSTVTMMRTIEDVLGVSHLSVHDSGVPPMTHAFDITQNCHAKEGKGSESTCWTYTAVPSQYLRNTTLPIPMGLLTSARGPRPTHDAAWWAAKTTGMDFSKEDMNDPAAFNRILWEGLKGSTPYPTTRSGAEIRHSAKPQAATNESSSNAGM